MDITGVCDAVHMEVVRLKQIVCNEPKHFVMRSCAVPEINVGQALVRVRRIGICGTDIHAFHGRQPFFSYPRVLGHELAGTIEQLDDEGDSGLRIGDQVTVIPYLHCGTCVACRLGKTNCCSALQVIGVHTDGGMGEFMAMPTSHLLPTNDLSLDQSAVLEPLSIGAHAVRRSSVQSGDTVLVIGAGPIGLGVMAFAKRKGATVIAMDTNEERLVHCSAWANVDASVNALSDDVYQQLARLTNDDFPVIVFDVTGNAQSMSAAIQYAAHGGAVVYVGLVKGDVCISDPEFHKRELTIRSSRNATLEDFAEVRAAIVDKSIDVNSYITHRVGFDQVLHDFERLTLPESKVIKAVIELPG